MRTLALGNAAPFVGPLAIEGMEGRGSYARRALAVVDREEGAAENLAARDIQLAAIFKRSDGRIGDATLHGS